MKNRVMCKKKTLEYGVWEWWEEKEVRETEREQQQMGD